MKNPYFRAFVKDNFLVFIGQILVLAKPLIIAPFVIKTIGVETFGAYVLILSMVGFIIGTAPLGTGFLFRRFAPSETDLAARGNLFYRQFVFQLFSIALCICLLLIFNKTIKAALFRDASDFSMIFLAVYTLCYLIYGQATTYFRYTGRMRNFVYATVAFPYISIAVIALAYFAGIKLNINSLLLVDIFSLIVVAAVWGIKISLEIGLKPRLPELIELKKDLSLGFPGVLSFWTDFFLNTSSRYIISFFISLAAVGSYSAALQLGFIASVLPRILGVAIPPLLAKAVDSGNLNEASIMIDYAIKGFLTIAVPFSIMSIFFAKPVLSLYANKIVADSAYFLIPLTAASCVFYGLSNLLSIAMSISLKTKDIFWANLTASFLNVGINLAGLYYWRSLAVPGLAAIAGYAVVFVMLKKKLPESWNISLNTAYILKSGLSAFTAGISGYALLMFLTKSGAGLRLIIGPVLLVTLLIHTAIILSVRVISKKEIEYARNCFKLASAKFSVLSA